MDIRWKLKELLEARGTNPYALARAMGGIEKAPKVYRLVRADKPPKSVDFKTLADLAEGLERLTGSPVAVADLLELDATPTPAPVAPGLETEDEPEDSTNEREALADWEHAGLLTVTDHLFEIEQDMTPEELGQDRAMWRETFARSVPVVFDPERRVFLEGAEAEEYRARTGKAGRR